MPAGLSLRVVALGLATSLLTAAPAAAQSNDQERQDQVIAEVGGDKIYRRDFERAFTSLPAQAQQQGRQQLYGRILEGLIQQMAVMQAGRASGLAEDPEVKNRLRLVESQLVSDLYLRRAVENDLTDEKLREAYSEWLTQNPPTEQVRARHILVETEEKAREMIALVTQGQDFAELARQHSTGPSAAQGGDLGYFERDRMVKPFADVAFGLQPNQFSADPVQTQFGWHVILVEDRKTADPPSFEQVRPQIGRQMADRLARQVANDLVSKAEVQRFDLTGNPIAAPPPQ